MLTSRGRIAFACFWGVSILAVGVVGAGAGALVYLPVLVLLVPLLVWHRATLNNKPRLFVTILGIATEICMALVWLTIYTQVVLTYCPVRYQ